VEKVPVKTQAPPPPSLTPSAVTLARLESQLFVPADGSSYRWSLVEGDAGGTISPQGFYLAPETNGSYHIIAERSTDGAQAQATVTVVIRDLVDSGGQVLPNTRIHAVYWGDHTVLPPDGIQAVEAFFNGLNGSAYLGIVNQYLRGTPASVEFVQTILDDANPPPVLNPSGIQVQDEVCRIIERDGLNLTEGDIVFVFRSAPAVAEANQGACGWHLMLECNGQSIAVAYVATPAGSGGSCVGLLECGGYSAGAMGMVNFSAHEFIESITDPNAFVPSWLDDGGDEAADKCINDRATCSSLPNGTFLLPQIYSNATHTCVLE
jgi:hypothetical protein